MFVQRKGIAPLVIILIVALGLVGGAAAGYGFREPLKKMVSGTTTAEEIQNAVNQELAKFQLGKTKFELEGTTAGVDVSSKTITVKIKSSTNSIKELRLSEAPIIVADDARITMGDQKDLTIADIPINSQVHVGGTISDGKLTATKVIIQKEDVAEEQGDVAKQKDFEVEGVVKSVASNSLTVTVSSASKRANSQKGKDLVVKVISTTVIEKNEAAITLADIKMNDEVEVEGVIENDIYMASKIEVKVEEEGEELEESEDSESPGNSQNRGQSGESRGNSENQGKETEEENED